MTYHREPNMVQWVGVRPAHNGVQVLVRESVAAGSATIYTVAAGYVLLLYDAVLWSAAQVTGLGYLTVWNATPALVCALCGLRSQLNTSLPGHSFHTALPIELVEGWSVRVTSTGVAHTVYGEIHGVLVPVGEF